MHGIVLYCLVLYCIILHCIILSNCIILLHCIGYDYNALHCIVLYCIVMDRIELYGAVLCCVCQPFFIYLCSLFDSFLLFYIIILYISFSITSYHNTVTFVTLSLSGCELWTILDQPYFSGNLVDDEVRSVRYTVQLTDFL